MNPKYKSRAFLLAKVEALGAENFALNAECVKLRASLQQSQFDARNLQSEVTALRHTQREVTRDVQHIEFGALQERCRRLNANGVPATIHRGHVIHSRTRAVIQPGQFGVGT